MERPTDELSLQFRRCGVYLAEEDRSLNGVQSCKDGLDLFYRWCPIENLSVSGLP